MTRFALAILSISLFPTLTLAQGGQNPSVGSPGWRPQPSRYINHTVQPGETLSGIAERYYGNKYRWEVLHEYNNVYDPDRLRVGQIIYVPDPIQNISPPPQPVPNGGNQVPQPTLPIHNNPPPVTTDQNNIHFGPGGWSLGDFLKQFKSAKIFGTSLWKVFVFLCIFFIVHAVIQGAFVWFAAHLSFVKDVSFGKAMRATVQSEGLASVLLFGFAIMGLALVYVGTSPPGKPALDQLLTTVEGFLGSSTGLSVVGGGLVLLYCFLGIRFIPGAFEIPSAQAVAVVFLAVLIPHAVMCYLLGARLGLFGPGASSQVPVG